MAERDEDGLPDPWSLLTREERLIIALVRFGGMTNRRVASVLGVAHETVNSMISQGLNRLVGEPRRWPGAAT